MYIAVSIVMIMANMPSGTDSIKGSLMNKENPNDSTLQPSSNEQLDAT
jgi:hypothetical protein